eukprot:1065205-Amphidinium_carterae.1
MGLTENTPHLAAVIAGIEGQPIARSDTQQCNAKAIQSSYGQGGIRLCGRIFLPVLCQKCFLNLNFYIDLGL